MIMPLFLLGAGFNKDAKGEAGPIDGYGKDSDYPLLNDLWNICFPNEKINPNISIEQKFAKAIENGNTKPLDLLCEEILKCDNYLVPELFSIDLKRDVYKIKRFDDQSISNYLLKNKRSETKYSIFFKTFKDSSFLTFNYDALCEVFLLRMNKWYPYDGYGISLKTEIDPFSNTNTLQSSFNFVIHLHGSLYIYPSESIIKNEGEKYRRLYLRNSPEFRFDPGPNAGLFYPYQKVMPELGDDFSFKNRVIAPVPNKAKGLSKKFVQTIYSKAKELLLQTNLLISIGYDFNPHDEISYHVLLENFSRQSNPKCILITPNAEIIERRLRKNYSYINWESIPLTFEQWVKQGYIGLNN